MNRNKQRRCSHCHAFFQPNPRVKEQKYCRKKECQRARKAKWQREKIQNDPDYRKNKTDYQDEWRKRNPEYYRRYRKNHPEYEERNRQLQKGRDAKKRRGDLAKVDASSPKSIIKQGYYRIVPVRHGDLAKVDASEEEFYIISSIYRNSCRSCKSGLDRL